MTSPSPLRPPSPRIAAETVEEFLELLRRILYHSGLTAGQVSVSSKLPRSTCYWFVNHGNSKLPKSREQVEQFARACRLNVFQIAQVVGLWDKLRDASVPILDPVPAKLVELDSAEVMQLTDPDAPATELRHMPGDDASGVAGTSDRLYLVTRSRSHREALEQRWGAGAPDAAGADQESEPPEHEQPKKKIGVVQRITRMSPSDRTDAPTATARPAPTHLDLGEFHRCVLLLVVLTLFPVAAVLLFGRSSTSPVTMMAALLLLIALHLGAPWLARSASLRSQGRIMIAALIAAAASTLAWMAIGSAPITLLTGLLTFVAAPLWLDAITLAGWRLTSRSIFALIISAGSATTAGLLVVGAGGGIAAMVLVALITYAEVLMAMPIWLRRGTAALPDSDVESTRF